MHAVGAARAASADPQHPGLLGEDGPGGRSGCLRRGANDLGGTLMDETITRSAGASHGQEMTPAEMEGIIRSLGRAPRQRTTLYATAPERCCALRFEARARGCTAGGRAEVRARWRSDVKVGATSSIHFTDAR